LRYRGGLRFGYDVVIVKPPAKGGVSGDLGIAHAKIGINGVVSESILARAALDLRNTLPAKAFVGNERGGSGLPVCSRQNRRKRHSVLDRLVGALAEMREHRVRGIAQESKPSAGPCRQRLTVIESPPKRHLNLLQQ
jgi:hypothetical protein